MGTTVPTADALDVIGNLISLCLSDVDEVAITDFGELGEAEVGRLFLFADDLDSAGQSLRELAGRIRNSAIEGAREAEDRAMGKAEFQRHRERMTSALRERANRYGEEG